MRLTPRTTIALACLAAALAPAPARAQSDPPAVRAPSALLVDARTGEVLFAREPGERRSIASATKLMTALLALERARPTDVFRAPAYDALPIESKIDLRRGERMTVEDLLEALLLESANDAAATIAAGVSGSRERFVADMNARAKELGLDGTSYANPIGLDDPDNYSTAEDLAALARRLLDDDLFAEIVDRPRSVLESGSRRRVVDNRNRLIGRAAFVDGVKTGHTRRAGYVLVGSASGRGAQVVSVVLGEPSEAARDADTLALLRFGIDQFRRVPVLRTERPVAEAEIDWHDGRVKLVPERAAAVTVRRGRRPEVSVDAPDELEGPLERGARVGEVTVTYDGRTVARSPLVTAAPVPGAGAARRFVRTVGTPLLSLGGVIILLAAMLTLLRIRALRMRRARA